MEKENKKRRPMNLRKKPRILTIQPSDKPVTILIFAEPTKTRIWLEGLPDDAILERPSETVDNNP